ncbi:MAG: hypothetical protein AAB152_04255 [Candidatus Coatesbacteria bacterium]
MTAATACLAVLLAAGSAFAADGAGSAGGLLARLPFGARVLALGGAQGALPDSPGSLLVNPAAAGAVGPGAVEAGLDQGVEDVRYEGLAAAGDILPWFSGGIALQTLGAGTIETYDYVGTRYTADLESDRLVALAAAARTGPLCAGASLKYVSSTLLGTYKSSAMLGDLGARLRLRLSPPDWYDEDTAQVENPNWLVLSFAAANVGQRFDYGGASDASPLVWRSGALVEQALSRRARLLLSFAADVPRATAQPEGRTGVEVVWPVSTVAVAVRVGVRMARDGGVFSGGLGLAIRGISVDYAYLGKLGPFDATHHMSLGFNLGAFRGSAAKTEAGLAAVPVQSTIDGRKEPAVATPRSEPAVSTPTEPAVATPRSEPAVATPRKEPAVSTATEPAVSTPPPAAVKEPAADKPLEEAPNF